jgi:hypothetical protein
MKVGLIASILLHVGGLALLPGHEAQPARSNQSVVDACRCDYELTVTDSRPPRALTLGQVPEGRFAH